MTPINSQILERSPENDLFDDTKGGILISLEGGRGEGGRVDEDKRRKAIAIPNRYICFPLSLADVLIKLPRLFYSVGDVSRFSLDCQ